ncbi:MAG: GNAT family N-acetyltransferase [Asticcacaulis sp.]|uniref:GNAT family N-acetyltransferase n=1 Tax=Asticcacaulis sp. TaxID=1872648 RepID=UPI0039E50FF0
MTVQIREAVSSDLDGLLALYAQLHPSDPRLPSDMAARIFTEMQARAGLSVLMAVVDGQLVGSVTLVIVPNLTRGGAPYALVENVVTDDGYRRQGIGRALLVEAAWRAEAAGYYKLMLLTGRTEPHVQAFYKQCGFSQNKVGFQIRFGGR